MVLGQKKLFLDTGFTTACPEPFYGGAGLWATLLEYMLREDDRHLH